MRLRGATLAAILVILGGVLLPGWTEARPRRSATVAAAAQPVCPKLRARLDAMAVEDSYRALQSDLEDCLRRAPPGADPRYDPFRLYDTHNQEATSPAESLVGRYKELAGRGGLSAGELVKLKRWLQGLPSAAVGGAPQPVCPRLRARLDAMGVDDSYRSLQADLEDCLRRDTRGDDPRYNPFRLYDTHNLEARSTDPESLVGRYQELAGRGGLSAGELAKLNRWLQGLRYGLRYAAAFAECRAGTDKGDFCQANPSCERAVTLGSFDAALAWPALFLSARSHLECRQPQVARERCQQALALAEAGRSAEREQQARLCLCRAALALRDQREQALEQGRKALALATASGDEGARSSAQACLDAVPPPPPLRPPRVRDQRRLAVGYTVLTLGVLALAAGGALVSTDCTAVTRNPVNGGSCISSYGRATPGYVLLGGGGLLAAIGLPLAVIATIGKPGPQPILTVSALARF